MSNSTLDARAKALERDLSPKLKCYVRVGWMRDQSGAETFMVYVDRRANINYSIFPDNWYGSLIDVQLVWPPGVNPPDPLPDFPWM